MLTYGPWVWFSWFQSPWLVWCISYRMGSVYSWLVVGMASRLHASSSQSTSTWTQKDYSQHQSEHKKITVNIKLNTITVQSGSCEIYVYYCLLNTATMVVFSSSTSSMFNCYMSYCFYCSKIYFWKNTEFSTNPAHCLHQSFKYTPH